MIIPSFKLWREIWWVLRPWNFDAKTLGKPPNPDLKAAPFPFGVVAPIGDSGTSFPIRMILGCVLIIKHAMENDSNISHASIYTIYSTIYTGCFFLFVI